MAKYGNAGGRGRLHAVVVAAGRGKVPSWSNTGKKRKQHMVRVADLMGEWGEVMGLRKNEIVRWRAAGLLHDVVRDTPPHELRPIVPEKLRDLPGKAYHGPAASVLLAKDGVKDEEFLHAIRWHTLGSKSFGRLGKALYAADFLEPGRLSRRRWREGLRERAPRNLDRVLREIVGSKIDYLVRAELPVHRRTVRFWNSLVENP